MNVSPENIIVNSCEYTPIYLIPSTSVTQTGPYYITQSNQDAPEPIADNLKAFYENSGNLESGLLNNNNKKPRILKKVGNNLKLASFLLPKCESVNVNVANIAPALPPAVQPKQPIPSLASPLVKPPAPPPPPPAPHAVTTPTNNAENNLLEIDRKIVRVGTIPTTKRTYYPRVLPKNKPKEPKEKIPTEITTTLSNPLSKHTSVQLIKLGETYHSLSQLSDEQMKIVNKALKMFTDPEKVPKEPAYDPVTNTKFIYKVVSPRDLTVVGRNKNVVPIIKKKPEVKKQKVVVCEEPPEEPIIESECSSQAAGGGAVGLGVGAVDPVSGPVKSGPGAVGPGTGAVKTTRSGRTVRVPRALRAPVSAAHKPKKKVGSLVTCFQCSAEFCSLYRLQRHYELYPTHIPARVHSDLFHCLLAILKGSGGARGAGVLVQQLHQLVAKLRALLPCLLRPAVGAGAGGDDYECTLTEHVGSIFGVTPGKYNLNVDALYCVKDKEGRCAHDPPPAASAAPAPAPAPAPPDAASEDCARIHSVDKWPTVTKRSWRRERPDPDPAKRMRLASAGDRPDEPAVEAGGAEAEGGEAGAGRFRSAHFDIRSSPIKLPSALARRFQLRPERRVWYSDPAPAPAPALHRIRDEILQFVEESDTPPEPPLAPPAPAPAPAPGTPEPRNGFCEASTLKPKCNSLIGSPALRVKLDLFESPGGAGGGGGGDPFGPGSAPGSDAADCLFASSLLDAKGAPDPAPDDVFGAVLRRTPERPYALDEHAQHAPGPDPAPGFDPASSLDPAPSLDVKRDCPNDSNRGDALSASDHSLLNNILDALGNETLHLAYPETEIRNTSVDFEIRNPSVDFHLDLFSFTNS